MICDIYIHELAHALTTDVYLQDDIDLSQDIYDSMACYVQCHNMSR